MTASNPLLRPRAPTPVLQPRFSEETIDLQLLHRAGVEFSGNLTHRIKGIVISLDWHQVCDTIRISKFQTLRCDDRGHYYLLEPLKEKLAELPGDPQLCDLGDFECKVVSQAMCMHI